MKAPFAKRIKSNLARQRDYQEVRKNPDARSDAPDTGIKESLNPFNLKDWLYDSGLIKRELLLQPGCVRIKTAEGGASTEQLFFVFYKPNCAESDQFKLAFVIKEIQEAKVKKEISNLNILKRHPNIREGKLRDPSMPQMTFAEGFYSYEDEKGIKRYIVLLHADKGQCLMDYFDEGVDNPKTLEAFRKLGETLGNFNKKFMSGKNCLIEGGTNVFECNSITHGDLHPNNIFYDGKFIYFIDVETMSNSLQKKSFFLDDAVYLYLLPVYYWETDKSSYDRVYNVFLEEYLQHLSDSPSVREKLKIEIKTLIERNKHKYKRS